MGPRNRDKKNHRLVGTNIKKVTTPGQTYYYYIMPDGSMEALEHGNEEASIEAAVALNRILRPSGNVVDRILSAPARPTALNPPVVEVLHRFRTEWLPKQNYSPSSLKQREIKIAQYRKAWPHELIDSIDTFSVAQFLGEFGAESARQHRVLLEQFFRFAASRGYSTQRPMIDIERCRQEKRKRVRHTWDGHRAIHEAAPPWLQRAIDIAVLSLQRRADLVAIRTTDQVDLKRKTIRINQQKSQNYDKPVFIDIVMGEELYKAVLSCVWSGVKCPYLVHHRPRRLTKQMRDSRPHAFSVPADYLSRAYSEVRDQVGVYNHLPKLERPGFHSLRALGIWLYTKAGYSDEYVMALAGHANERMKNHYQEGHEKVEPVKVNAELSFSALDLSAISWETDLSTELKTLADAAD